jgi:bacterioferritin (cytochrome b1)
MQGDPAVIKVLNDVFFLEATVFELTHAVEHVFEGRKYKGLRCWYDKQVDHSRCRRRCLTDRCFQLGGTLTVAIRTTIVDPRTAPETFLAETLTLAQELLTAYQNGYHLADEAGDNITADDLCDLQKSVEGLVSCLEAFADQIADIGIQAFLALRVK